MKLQETQELSSSRINFLNVNDENIKLVSDKVFNEFIDFKNKHYKNSDFDLIQILLSFCYEYSYEPGEVGEVLAENQEFVEILKNNAIKNYYLKTEIEDFNEPNEEEW